mmetsp:Transcript_22667/g.45357  ORF Transcript_22667/g.45357 Transcript_22667/m.45357 type:complete len:282 (-) Transcript_22667:33-878(-)|eukprot:CAMPEP_0194303652 /NCGR_PEP_ID=MMETSP0171-20130528/1485_1 /TAXON_ID=218684 /ORGANISM="Corethron pennatum, Strain L29A3" /LENGTH=281 /DNA_ID=CAMNT_0039054623 /DNA_START=11 /DNA_END=856 /DNA_ORIENTATION=+
MKFSTICLLAPLQLCAAYMGSGGYLSQLSEVRSSASATVDAPPADPVVAEVAAPAEPVPVAVAVAPADPVTAAAAPAPPVGQFADGVDEAAAFAASTFPIAPADLIARAKEVLSRDVGLGTKDGGECLAEDFEFVAQVVGPIGREEYLGALGTFDLESAFDITPNGFGFSVDPLQTNRVWFFNRVRATHTGTFMGAEPTGKQVVYPPQVQHIDFDESGKIREYGFYTADRRQGNTGGLGGAFGFMAAVGKSPPVPEFRPYKRSKRFRALLFFGDFMKRFQK